MARRGAKTATSSNITVITRPAIASLLRFICRQTIPQ